MRSEQEMLDMIKGTAEKDENIRAAYLEGSRTNPKVPRDIFQDYDVVYIVSDTAPFREDREWINRFGERMYMQYPEEGIYFEGDAEQSYGWLIQFSDGNRLDLHVCTKEYALSHLELYRTLIDKDGIMPKEAESSDAIYWVKKPLEEEFLCTCNEFWWCLNNVGKGLWRKELPYVMDMIDFNIRPMLKRLLEWKIGMEQEFCVSPGKAGKYMGKFLSEEEYQMFLATYSAAEESAVWKAVFSMCGLFQRIALEVSEKLGFHYNMAEADNSRRFLEHVKTLPRDAEEIY